MASELKTRADVVAKINALELKRSEEEARLKHLEEPVKNDMKGYLDLMNSPAVQGISKRIEGYTGEISFPVDHWPGRMHEAKTCTILIEQLVARFREKGYQVDEIKGGAKFRGGWGVSRVLPGGKTSLGIGIHESFVYDEAGTLVQKCVADIVINHGPIEL